MSARSAMGAGAGTGRYQSASNDDNYFVSQQEIVSEAGWNDPKLRIVYPADRSEVLSLVEDLWLRLVRHPEVHATVSRYASTGAPLVMFRFDDDDDDGERFQLLQAAASCESYWWSQDGNRGTLAAGIHWLGNTLAIELASSDQMRRWPDGDALEWSMQTLLQRIRCLGTSSASHFAIHASARRARTQQCTLK